MVEEISHAADFLKKRGVAAPHVGVILGTGLGSLFASRIKNAMAIPYAEIPHFPVSTVESHQGRLIYGEIGGRMVLAMQGRFHYYEGYSMQQVTFPVRVMRALGVTRLLISNASGKLNKAWAVGELMVIDDHINLLPDNPLRGKNYDELGPRFPDLSAPYSEELNDRLFAIGKKQGLHLRKGVYVSVAGPNLETRAEYRFLANIGADAVGMSTVPEVIVANHAGLPCCAVSVLTDNCDPDNLKPVSLEEIIAVSKKAEPALVALFTALIAEL